MLFINRNLTNMSMKFILLLNIIIFEMITLTNVIFVTTVFKPISTFLNILKMFIIQNKRIYRCNFCTNSFDTKSNYKQAFKALRADSCMSGIVVAMISLIKVKILIFQSKLITLFDFYSKAEQVNCLGWASVNFFQYQLR